MKKMPTIKQGLLLLGSFSIACDFSTIAHELSHGTAAILTGGSFAGIILNPFSWSYCYSYTSNQLVHGVAGAGGAILLGALLFCIFYHWARPWLLPLLLIGSVALLDNGSYFFIDIVMRSGGDACRLIDQGIPAAASASMGTLCIAEGFVPAILLIRKLGLLRFDFKGQLIVPANDIKQSKLLYQT
jgi:hypothetical protein